VTVRPVHGHVGEEGQHLASPVGRLPRGEQVRPFLDERRREVAGHEPRLREHRPQERDVGPHPPDAVLGEGAARAGDGGRQVLSPAGELHEHRVEVRRDLRAGMRRRAVDPHAGPARRAVHRDAPRIRTELVRRVLGGDPRLQGGAVHAHRLLRDADLAQGLPRRDAHLRLDEVHIGHFLGDRVLHLDPRVHLDEDVLPRPLPRRLQEELDGAGVDIPDGAGEGDGVGAELVPDRWVEVGRRRDLDDLLVPPLHRAVALEQVDDVPGGVREDLHLDVPRAQHRLLEEDGRVAEGAARLAHRGAQGLGELLARRHSPHAAATAARHRLDEQREANRLGRLEEFLRVRRRRAAAQHGDTGLPGGLERPDFVAGQFDDLRRRSDERDARRRTGGRELGVLGEEPVTGVDRVGTGLAHHAEDLGDVQVRPDGVADHADRVGLVGLQPMLGRTVLMGEHSDRARAQFVGGAEAANGDLGPVCDKDLAEHGSPLDSTRSG